MSKRNLLVLTERRKDGKAFSSYQHEIFDNVLQHMEKIYGRWDDVQLIGTDSPQDLINTAKDAQVLLVGSNHAEAIHNYTKLSIRRLHGPSLYGIPTINAGRNIIATPYMSDYGLGDDATILRASLLGHLYRHLELLYTGIIGWDNPEEPAFYQLIRNRKDWNELQRLLKTKRIVCIDSETSKGLQRIGNSLITLQFGFDGKTGWVLPLAHPESPLSGSIIPDILSFLKDYFERHKSTIQVFHNAVFDLHQLIDLLKLQWYNHKIYDTSIGQFNLDESYEARKLIGYKKGEFWSLERLCIESGMDHYNRTKLGKGDRTRLETKPLEDVAEYAGVDVVLPLRLMKMQRAIAKYRNERIAGRPYERFDKNVIEVDGIKLQQITFLERNGLKMDINYVLSLNGNSGVFLEEIKKSEANFKQQPAVQQANAMLLAQNNVRSSTLFGKKEDGGAFVLNPRKREHQITLFDKILKLKPLAFGVGNLPKYNKAFKEKYKDHPVVAAFGDLIEALSLHANFIVGFYKILRGSPDNADGRLHTIFKFLEVKTGRVSSIKPNLQNITQRSKTRSKIIKRQFICEDCNLILKRDFCLAAGTLIPTERGLIKIEDIGKYISSNGKIIVAGAEKLVPAIDWLCNGKKQVFKIKTKNGNTLEATDRHQILVFDQANEHKWVMVKDLKLGDLLCLNPTYSQMHIKHNYAYTPITSITEAGNKLVYDLTIAAGNIPAFVANGIIVHNSAHEIRVWGISARDKVLASTFWKGMRTRLEYLTFRKIPDELKAEWETKLKAADVHRINHSLLYGGKPENVNKIQRDSVKSVIFGVLYGLGMLSLGKKLVNYIPGRLKEIEKELKEIEERIEKINYK